MKCPHCGIHFHSNWNKKDIHRYHGVIDWSYETSKCPACNEYIIVLYKNDNSHVIVAYPQGANRGPIPKEVPGDISEDYREACEVLPISPKASAALSRRCLQAMLRANGYKASDLSKEIDLLLADQKLPSDVHTTVDLIRNFGNFSAHPITDQSSLQIIPVEAHEAETCLEILEALFDHFYVKPAIAQA